MENADRMTYLPYRDIVPQPDSGGTPTANYIDTMPGRPKQPFTVDSNTSEMTETNAKKPRPSYKSELKEMTRQRNIWKRIALLMLGAFIGTVITYIIFG